jgi:hypothetical protein
MSEEEEIPVTEADGAPALPEVLVATPANCTGELVLLPDHADPYYSYYECQVCHQTVLVSREYLAEYGLPPEHSSVLV